MISKVAVPKHGGIRPQLLYLQWLLGPHIMMLGYLEPQGRRLATSFSLSLTNSLKLMRQGHFWLNFQVGNDEGADSYEVCLQGITVTTSRKCS